MSSSKLKSAVLFFLLILPLIAFGTQEQSHPFDVVFNEHIKTLKHLDQINPQMMIFFSGFFGSGKTNTAEYLEEKLNAIRLNGDEMRDLLVAAGFKKDEIEEYFAYCLLKLHEISNNRMFIIDRHYDTNPEYYQKFVRDFGSLAFLIRLELPKEIGYERMVRRGGDKLPLLIKQFDEVYEKYRVSGEEGQFDYIIDNSQEGYAFDEELCNKIESKFCFRSPQYRTKAFSEMRNAILEYAESGEPVAFESKFSMILPGLYVANQKTTLEMVSKNRARITSVISCRSQPEKVEFNVNRWLLLLVGDYADFPILENIDEVFEFIENADKGIVIHCLLGSSRSPAIIAAYLMKKYWIPFSSAYAYIKKKHPNTKEISLFEKQLIEYESRLGF